MSLHALKARIIARYGTITAFLDNHDLPVCRQAVYATLRGKYKGRAGDVVAMIEDALGLIGTEQELVYDAIRGAMCAHCRGRKPDCNKCRAMLADMAIAAMDAMERSHAG